jgi:eukaryotic-like serine/threonine-protein kinase
VAEGAGLENRYTRKGIVGSNPTLSVLSALSLGTIRRYPSAVFPGHRHRVLHLLGELQQALAGRYRLDRELGRGGMATVFLAHDLRHDRPVALKLLHPELAVRLGPERFQREIKLAARLQHPHILTVHDSGEAAGQLWFTMPYVEGESLRDRLRREIQLPVEDALRITMDTARGLEYAHQHGVMHRDIKPENLLLTRDGSTLIADFGIARALGSDTEQLTRTGLSVGTPAYMSPEQAEGDRNLDARTDVYSLGTVLYEMLAGEPPYNGPTAQAIVAKRLLDPVPSVRRARLSVPEALDQAVTRSLAIIPADRFASAADFAQALQSALSAPPATAAVPTTIQFTGRRRWRSPLVASAAGLGIVIALGAWFAWRRHSDGRRVDAPLKRLAVLPFESMGDSSQDYFADGVSDEVRGKLSQLPGLAVIARSSSNEYRRTRKPLHQIARELGVEYLLTATVRWERHPDGSSRVRVSPELVRIDPSSSPTTKWQQGFDAALTDVFGVQADIAAQVANALDVQLGGQARERLTRKPTENVAAYDAYLQAVSQAGDEYFDPANQPLVVHAIETLTRAITLDPEFAMAWARLGQAHVERLRMLGKGEDSAAAMDAAVRALSLDSNNAAIRLTASYVFAAVAHDSVRARRELATAVRLAPNDPAVLSVLAFNEGGKDRIPRLRHAQVLNPRSSEIASRLYFALGMEGRYREAVAEADRWASLESHSPNALVAPVCARLLAGDSAGAAQLALTRVSGPDNKEGLLGLLNAGFLWILPREMQRRALELPPAIYGGNRTWWANGMSDAARTLGDSGLMRAYADSGLRAPPSGAMEELVLRAQLFAMAGNRDAAERMIARYRQRVAGDYIASPNVLLGFTYTYLPDPPDSAVKYISRSIDDGTGRACDAAAVRYAPTYAFVRRSPAFKPYLDQIVTGRYRVPAP